MNLSNPKIYFIKRLLNVITLIFSLLLFIDLILDKEVSKEVIEHHTSYIQLKKRTREKIYGLITNKGEYPLSEKNLYYASKNKDFIYVTKTKIFNEVLKIKHRNVEYSKPSYTIYKMYYLLPLLCIFSSILALFFNVLQLKYYTFTIVLSTLLMLFLSLCMITNSII